jgi:hypothetical protein
MRDNSWTNEEIRSVKVNKIKAQKVEAIVHFGT